MNFIRPNLFDFAKNSTLKSQFKGTKRIAKDLGIHFDDAAIQSLNPQILFDQLTKGKINLELIQVFALMGWENHQWTSKNGKTAMRNWWLSALDKDQQGESVFRQVMLLRTILADTERYPAPKNVIQTLRTGLEDLIQSGEWKYTHHLDVLQVLITQNAKKLAEIAFKQEKSVIALMQEAGFPQRLPIVQEAEVNWLDQWIASTKSKRQILRPALTQILNPTLSLERQKCFTQQILNSTTLPKEISALEKQVENFPELVTWLSTCARNTEFQSELVLKHNEKQRLACWIGTGNYEALRKILIDIANIYDQDTANKTANRYIFWKNYQALFQEAWLLLPTAIFDKTNIHLNNIKKISTYSYPVVVLKVMDKFIFQSFLGDASQNDLLMTDDIFQVERILHQNIVDYEQLKNLNLVLIHDHAFKWQTDLAYTLDKHFNIKPKDKIVYYMEGKSRYSHYLQEVNESYFKLEREDWKNLPRWVKNNKHDNKYPVQVFNRAALTAKRYNLI
ncbi:hypothetical protein [Acinetobacter sp. WCHA45]|uniref:hypothetical protein n=1 Tax=Acinetobacter sp. WCHA45 TaxID=2004644 RepID=UPI000B3C7364|nr:hypothetical protein [Acinetobacter sp. WCHA45]AVZ85755.1 hypothetical protein CDG55_08360 [Acinetobacter sp. WCHA45]